MASRHSKPSSHPAVIPSTPSPLLGGSQSKEIVKTNGSTRSRVSDALKTPRAPSIQKRNGKKPSVQEMIIPDPWDDSDELLPSEKDFVNEYIEDDIDDIDPLGPTRAKPGSEEKVLMMAARQAAGMPLWHQEDVTDHGPSTKKGELAAVSQSSTKAKGRPSDIVKQSGLADEVGEMSDDSEDEDDDDEL